MADALNTVDLVPDLHQSRLAGHCWASALVLRPVGVAHGDMMTQGLLISGLSAVQT